MKGRKKILILVARSAQLPLIKAAKNEGYHVIVCDYNHMNPGVSYADTYYKINPLDKCAVLEIARKEAISGIISNYEDVMGVVAFVAQTLNLVGNTTESIDILLSKYKFRERQQRSGLYTPKYYIATSYEAFCQGVIDVGYPLIIKPIGSFGSQGVTVCESDKEINVGYQNALQYAHNNAIEIEEYVPMPSMTIIEGDVFIHKGHLMCNGIFFNIRSKEKSNVPMCYSLPARFSIVQQQIIERSLSRIFNDVGIIHGEYNVEMYFTESGELFIVEINARQGGVGIPELIRLQCGIDYHKLLVTTIMGDDTYFDSIVLQNASNNFITQLLVYSKHDGIYDSLEIAFEIRDFVVDIIESKRKGDSVNKVSNMSDSIAMVRLKFHSYEQQQYYNEKLEQLIYPKIKEKV